MADFQPLSAEEHSIIDRVVNIIQEQTAVPCTTCRYCETGCPKHIAIPDYFALYNSARRATSPNFSSQFVYYTNLAATHGRAGDCIGCGQCERACPQHLEITRFLKDVSEAFDGAPQFPTRKEA